MSVLPKTWDSVRFADVVEINPRPELDDIDENMLASFVPMKCVEEESGRFESLEDRKVKDVRKGYTPFKDGDVLFAKVTPCMENGKAAVVTGLKGCPRGAFLGLCEEERVKGVKTGHYTRSKLNKEYAMEAVRLLRLEPSLVSDRAQLWRRVIGQKTKAHNGQLDVVIGLWNAGLLASSI